jgi:capsular exopolysaccharide synthesis family protein
VWSALRRGWPTIVAGLVLGAVIALLVSVLVGPRYSTHMQFFVSTTDSASTSDAFQGGQFAQQRVASYTELLSGEELATRVVDALDLDVTPGRVAGDVVGTTVTGTVLIDVTVTDPSQQVAEQIAGAVADEFPALVAELEASGVDEAPVTVALTDRPGAASAPSMALRNTLFGAILGLLLGAVAAVARALLDRTVRDKERAEALTGAPVTGIVFRDHELDRTHTIERMAPRTAEQYRQLATSLQYLDVDNPPKVIMVASSVPAEGKTTTVINLAMALADSGVRVTVVEADLRRPKVTEYLGLVSGVGLTNVLAGNADLDDVLQAVGDGCLRVLAAGPTPPNPGRLLGSAQMSVLLDKLRSDNDYVLVDAAPLLLVADSRGLAAHVDGVLLSVRHGKTTGDQLAEAAAALDAVGARTLGVVLNMVPLSGDLAQAHAYGVDYGYTSAAVPQPAAQDEPVAHPDPDVQSEPDTAPAPGSSEPEVESAAEADDAAEHETGHEPDGDADGEVAHAEAADDVADDAAQPASMTGRQV